MKKQRTLAELKHIGDEAFAEAQAAIDSSREVVLNSKELRRRVADLNGDQIEIPSLWKIR